MYISSAAAKSSDTTETGPAQTSYEPLQAEANNPNSDAIILATAPEKILGRHGYATLFSLATTTHYNPLNTTFGLDAGESISFSVTSPQVLDLATEKVLDGLRNAGEIPETQAIMSVRDALRPQVRGFSVERALASDTSLPKQTNLIASSKDVALDEADFSIRDASPTSGSIHFPASLNTTSSYLDSWLGGRSESPPTRDKLESTGSITANFKRTPEIFPRHGLETTMAVTATEPGIIVEPARRIERTFGIEPLNSAFKKVSEGLVALSLTNGYKTDFSASTNDKSYLTIDLRLRE